MYNDRIIDGSIDFSQYHGAICPDCGERIATRYITKMDMKEAYRLVPSAIHQKKVLFMQILVDADACPVKQIIVRMAKQRNIPVIMLIDTSHEISDGYSTIITVDKQADSVDYALMGLLTRDDIVVTQDFGLAAMVLGKGAKAVNQNGLIFSNDNIDKLLLERHIGQKVRRGGGRTKGPSKRTKEDDTRFEVAFEKLLLEG